MEEIYFSKVIGNEYDVTIYVVDKGAYNERFRLHINGIGICEYNKKSKVYFVAKRAFMALRPTDYEELCDAIAAREEVTRR